MSDTYLVTGAAGFIGFHVCQALLHNGHTVIGLDNLNDYYDPILKSNRINAIGDTPHFIFYKRDIANRTDMETLTKDHPEITHVVNLAAQASVPYSLKNPYAYIDANVYGHLNVLEMCRTLPTLKHLVYASTSSVYGYNTKMPFSVKDRVDAPMAIYAASKRAGELMTHSYSHLYKIPATGLRFFTVYGPWGRPDMAAYLFADALTHDRPIKVFNNGDMRRNFTYIDDIVSGVVACLQKPPQCPVNGALHTIYNIGNDRSEGLMDYIHTLELAFGKKAKIEFLPLLPGDVKETVADISESQADFGFSPQTNITEGIPLFVEWYKSYYGVS
ncbi:MAG: SDR family NAD(P)-dependent oxidoreductase [Alphaproteobacteria bacterium]|nr:MAG: SDR family NAD(P)-dependent oxidoreductase [Alphaproteobacteria bacterium]